MATDPAPYPVESEASNELIKLPFSGKTVGYLVLRLLIAILLIAPGIDKFKSATAPYSYDRVNWYGEYDKSTGEVVTPGRWLSTAKPVFEFGGFNNPEIYPNWAWMAKTTKDGKLISGNEIFSNFVSWTFYYYAQSLPYLMIAAGGLILIGLFNRFSLFLGGAIWISLVIGQATLPDNPTVFMLSMNTLMVAIAAALLKHNRISITRC